MANMSYCRFHNTCIDVYDCINTIAEIQEGEDDLISEYEASCGQDMFAAFLECCLSNEIIEDYNEKRIKELFNELVEKTE